MTSSAPATEEMAHQMAADQGFEPLTAVGAFTDLVGPMFHKTLDDGSRLLAMLALDKHLNAGGIVHGGLLMTLTDNALGRHVYHQMPKGTTMVTISLNTDFVSAARAGDWLIGEARIVRATRSVVFVEGGVRKDDTPIINAQGIWKILRRPDDS